MEIGTAVWIKNKHYKNDTDDLWIATSIFKKDKFEGKYYVTVTDGEGENSVYCLPQDHQELEDLKFRNPLRSNDHSASEVEVGNLVDLPFLNEPEILFCLKRRFYKDIIYTYTGKILISINPLREIPGLYSENILSQFSHDVKNLSPHVWNVANNTYKNLKRRLTIYHPPEIQLPPISNFSILISGESGSGKTESSKFILKYMIKAGKQSVEEEKLKRISKRDNSSSSPPRTQDTTEGNLSFPGEEKFSDSFYTRNQVSIMDKIILSNPILEAFGNSKTSRNHNSSRFGKLVNLDFNATGLLVGGSVQRYLLENVRVVKQQPGERSFHIFYQLIAGGSEMEKARWKLGPSESYNYINQGRVSNFRNINDKRDFIQLCGCFRKMNLDDNSIDAILDVVAGLLHLGQIQFNKVVDYSGDVSEIKDSKYVHHVARLCGFATNELEEILTCRTVFSRGEEFKKRFTPVQSIQARDAIAKTVYQVMFDWIVNAINTSIETRTEKLCATVGILDIFGFECFSKNHFEQLCINYTNETLQQQFNMYVFKMELLECQREKIEFSGINFIDNQESLDLIGTNLFQILDDQCKLPNASDKRFAAQIYKDLINKPKFSASKAEQRNGTFTILHYAGKVNYSTENIIEKNSDALPHGIISLLENSTNGILRSIPSDLLGLAQADNNAVKKTAAPTVSNQFKVQLSNLIKQMNETMPHYIRCIRPMDLDSNGMGGSISTQVRFNEFRVVEQLRHSGVLEAVKVARSGFPVRLSFHDFYSRYRIILPATERIRTQYNLPLVLPPDSDLQSLQEHCSALIQILFPNEIQNSTTKSRHRILNSRTFIDTGAIPKGKIQIGVTKVFLRQEDHDALESKRSKKFNDAVLKIQRFMRGSVIRIMFVDFRRSIVLLQKTARGMLARRHVINLWRNLRVTIIQRMARGFLGRIRYRKLRLFLYISKIQRAFRRYRFKKHMRQFKTSILRIQYRFRRSKRRKAELLRKSSSVQLVAKMPTEASGFGRSLTYSSIPTPSVNQPRGTSSILYTLPKNPIMPKVPAKTTSIAVTDAIPIKKLVSEPMMYSDEFKSREQIAELPFLKEVRETPAVPEVVPPEESTDASITESATDVLFSLNSIGSPKVMERHQRRESLREKPDVRSSTLQYKDLQDILNAEINELVSSFRISAKEALLRFDLKEAKKSLELWARQIQLEEFRVRTKRIVDNIDYGYNLIKAKKIIPLVLAAKIMHIGINSCRPEDRVVSARSANKQITRNHEMFENIYQLMNELKELMLIANAERDGLRDAVLRARTSYSENLQLYGAKYQVNFGKELDKEIAFGTESAYAFERIHEHCFILHQYYYGYIQMIVEEYGPNSNYKAQFSDDVDYIRSFAKLVGENKPLLSFEKRVFMPNNTDLVVANPLSIHDNLHLVENKPKFVMAFKNIAFKYMPHAPGIDFALCHLIAPLEEGIVHPTRLIRLIGKNSNNYGKVAYYQASTGFSESNLSEVLSNPTLIDAVNYKELSANIICSLLTACSDLKPDNIMIEYGTDLNNNDPIEKQTVNILGINVDSATQEGLFDFNRFSDDDTNICSSLRTLNVLYFFPQMFEPVDSNIVNILTRTEFAAEELMISWLKGLHTQNRKYESLLLSFLFTQDDLQRLLLPILLPIDCASQMYRKLQTICSLLKENPLASHEEIFRTLYPSMNLLYSEKRNVLPDFECLEKYPLQNMYTTALSDIIARTSNIRKAINRRQLLAYSLAKGNNNAMSPKGICFLSPDSQQSFSDSDENVQYEVYHRDGEVKVTESPMVFLKSIVSGSGDKSRAKASKAVNQTKSIDFADPSLNFAGRNAMHSKRGKNMYDTPNSNTSNRRGLRTASVDQVANSGTQSRSEPSSRYCCSIETVSCDFLKSVDFSKLVDDVDNSICRIIGESLKYVTTFYLHKISEVQLRSMFGGFISIAMTDKLIKNRQVHVKPVVMLGVFTKNVVISGLDEKAVDVLKKTRIVADMERVLGLDVSFLSSVDKSAVISNVTLLPVDEVHMSLFGDNGSSSISASESLLNESVILQHTNIDSVVSTTETVKPVNGGFSMSEYEGVNLQGKNERPSDIIRFGNQNQEELTPNRMQKKTFSSWMLPTRDDSSSTRDSKSLSSTSEGDEFVDRKKTQHVLNLEDKNVEINLELIPEDKFFEKSPPSALPISQFDSPVNETTNSRHSKTSSGDYGSSHHVFNSLEDPSFWTTNPRKAAVAGGRSLSSDSPAGEKLTKLATSHALFKADNPFSQSRSNSRHLKQKQTYI